MNYNVTPSFQFLKDIKYYVKKKKYTKLKTDIEEFKEELARGNLLGTVLTEIAEYKSIYKERMANRSINIGKSGGFRIIYYVDKRIKKIVLLTIFSKSKKDNLEDYEIQEIIKKYFITYTPIEDD